MTVLPLLRHNQSLLGQATLVERHEGVEERTAVVVQGSRAQTPDAQGEPSKFHPGVAILVHYEIKTAPGADVKEGLDALGGEPVFRLPSHIAPQMNQGTDMDVTVAKERRPAFLKIRPDSRLIFEDFPFHSIGQGGRTEFKLA